MIKWAIIFAVIGLIAGALGFAGIGGAAIGIAKFLFWAGIIIAVVLFVLGMTIAKKSDLTRRAPAPRFQINGLRGFAQAFSLAAIIPADLQKQLTGNTPRPPARPARPGCHHPGPRRTRRPAAPSASPSR